MNYWERLSDASFREAMDNPFEGMPFGHNRYTDELLRIADLNSDGLLDVWYIGAWGGTCNYVRTMEHRIDSALIEHSGGLEMNPTHPFYDLDFKGDEAHVLDWNGDGLMDLVLSHAGCNGLQVYQYFTYGGPPGVCYSHKPEHGALRYFEGQSDGKLKQTFGIFDHIDPEPGSKYRISIVDWDGDGDLDLILTSRSEKMHFYENKDGRLTDASNESALSHIGNLTLRYVEEPPRFWYFRRTLTAYSSRLGWRRIDGPYFGTRGSLFQTLTRWQPTGVMGGGFWGCFQFPWAGEGAEDEDVENALKTDDDDGDEDMLLILVVLLLLMMILIVLMLRCF